MGGSHRDDAIRRMSEKARVRRGSIWGKGVTRSGISPTGRSPSWVVDQAPEASHRMDIHPHDLNFVETNRSAEEIQTCSERLDERGAHRPIKDGLEDDGMAQALAEDEAVNPEKTDEDWSNNTST